MDILPTASFSEAIAKHESSLGINSDGQLGIDEAEEYQQQINERKEFENEVNTFIKNDNQSNSFELRDSSQRASGLNHASFGILPESPKRGISSLNELLDKDFTMQKPNIIKMNSNSNLHSSSSPVIDDTSVYVLGSDSPSKQYQQYQSQQRPSSLRLQQSSNLQHSPVRSSNLALQAALNSSNRASARITLSNASQTHSSSNRSLVSVPNPVIPKTVHAAFMRGTRKSFPSTAAEAKLRHGDMYHMLKATQLDKFNQQSKLDIFGIEVEFKNEEKKKKNGKDDDYDVDDDTQFSEGLLGRVQDLNRAFKRPIFSFTTDDLQRLQGMNVGLKAMKEEARIASSRDPLAKLRKNRPRYIPWESMPLDKAIRSKKPCIWLGDDVVKDTRTKSVNISRQFKDLERLFPPIDPEKIGTFVSVLTGKEMTKSTLDAKRATTLSIVMKRIGIKKSKFPKIAWAFREMDETFLTRENIELFQLNSMWPSNEELRSLRSRINAGKNLAEPDQFLWYIGTTVPDIATRIAAMAFKYEFEENVEGIMTACATIDIASKELMASRLLKKFLRIIVLIGNKINNQAKPLPPPTTTAIVKKPATTMTFTGIRSIPPPPAPKAPLAVHPETVGAKAITLESLLKLSSIRSPVDKSVTVLDYIAKYMEENAPELLEISSFLMCTPEAAKYDLAEQKKFLREARSGLQKIRLIPKMIDFYAEASKKLDEIERTTKRAEKSFQEVLLYFGYDNDAMESSNFFGQLKEFLNTFDAAVEKLSKSEEELKESEDKFNFVPISTKISMSNPRKSIFAGLGFGSGNRQAPPQIQTGRKSIFGRPR